MCRLNRTIAIVVLFSWKAVTDELKHRKLGGTRDTRGFANAIAEVTGSPYKKLSAMHSESKEHN